MFIGLLTKVNVSVASEYATIGGMRLPLALRPATTRMPDNGPLNVSSHCWPARAASSWRVYVPHTTNVAIANRHTNRDTRSPPIKV